MSPKKAAAAARTPTRSSPRLRRDRDSSLQSQQLNLEICVAVAHTPPSTFTQSQGAGTNDINATPRTRRRINERSNITLFQLSNVPSPLQQRDHHAEDEEYNRRCFEENCGADDSEEEPDVQDDVDREKAFHPTLQDRNISEEDKVDVSLNAFVQIKTEPGTGEEAWCFGAPVGWTPTVAPDDWKPSKKKAGEPEFVTVDNPGGWTEFTYRPKVNGKNKHLCHQLPTGVTPVPLDEASGKRTCEGWVFHYQGWK